MVSDLEIIEQHIIIRETIGYKALDKIQIENIPNVLGFLKIVHNYTKMKNIEKK